MAMASLGQAWNRNYYPVDSFFLYLYLGTVQSLIAGRKSLFRQPISNCFFHCGSLCHLNVGIGYLIKLSSSPFSSHYVASHLCCPPV